MLKIVSHLFFIKFKQIHLFYILNLKEKLIITMILDWEFWIDYVNKI